MQAGDVEKIVNAYGTVLAEPSALGVVRDARSLPYSKSEIKKALLVAPGVVRDSPLREQLRAGYISLGDFQRLSDREIRALQLWNRALSQNVSAADPKLMDMAETISAEGDLAIEI